MHKHYRYAFCMILVFSALIEYALVNSLTRMEADKKRKRREFAADGCGLPESPRKEMVINQKDSVNATEIVSPSPYKSRSTKYLFKA